MKTWKLVSGILSIIFFVIVSFQSCAVGIGNVITESGETSGSSGIIVAVFMLAGGIISIVSRKSYSNGGNIAMIILFALAAMIGFGNAGSYLDLYVWSLWCVINAVLAFVSCYFE